VTSDRLAGLSGHFIFADAVPIGNIWPQIAADDDGNYYSKR